MPSPTYFPVQADHEAYQALVAAGDPGTDVELDGILAAQAATENAMLSGWTALSQSYGWAPAQVTTPVPIIVGVPTGGITTSPLDYGGIAGYPGGMDEHTYAIDRFIIGGPATGSYLDAMRRAATLWLPLKRVYAKNGTLGGVVHGCKVTGATWQSLPLGDTTWIGLAVHTVTTCYYLLGAS